MVLPLAQRHASERRAPSEPVQHAPEIVSTTLIPVASTSSVVKGVYTTICVRLGGLAEATPVVSAMTATRTRSKPLRRTTVRSYEPPRTLDDTRPLPKRCHRPRKLPTRKAKGPPLRAFLKADDGTRTHDLLHGKQTL